MMPGASSRDRGHRWERELASWFTDTGFGDVRTGRSVTGGTQAGADLVTVTDDGPLWHVAGWSLEAKDDPSDRVPEWLRQAGRDANGRPYAVIHKRRNRATGQARVYVPRGWAEPLFVCDLSDDADYVTVDLWLFTALLAPVVAGVE